MDGGVCIRERHRLDASHSTAAICIVELNSIALEQCKYVDWNGRFILAGKSSATRLS